MDDKDVFRLTDAKFMHPSKALSPIKVTEFGMVMDARPLPENARRPIVVTELGMTVFLQPVTNVLVLVSITALQFSLES